MRHEIWANHLESDIVQTYSFSASERRKFPSAEVLLLGRILCWYQKLLTPRHVFFCFSRSCEKFVRIYVFVCIGRPAPLGPLFWNCKYECFSTSCISWSFCLVSMRRGCSRFVVLSIQTWSKIAIFPIFEWILLSWVQISVDIALHRLLVRQILPSLPASLVKRLRRSMGGEKAERSTMKIAFFPVTFARLWFNKQGSEIKVDLVS